MGGATGGVGDNAPHFWDQRGTGVQGGGPMKMIFASMFINATTRQQISIYPIGPYWYLLVVPHIWKSGGTKKFSARGLYPHLKIRGAAHVFTYNLWRRDRESHWAALFPLKCGYKRNYPLTHSLTHVWNRRRTSICTTTCIVVCEMARRQHFVRRYRPTRQQLLIRRCRHLSMVGHRAWPDRLELFDEVAMARL